MNFYVRVTGWSNGRRVQVAGNTVAMEIALSHSHCATCSERVHYVGKRLGTEGRWSYPGNGMFATFPLPEYVKKDQVSVAAYLSDKLALSIRPHG